MPDLPSRLTLFAIGRDYVLQKAVKIDPAQVDVEGSDANIFVGVASVMADAVVKHLGYRTAALTLGGGDDEDLDRYTLDRYGSELPRKGASPARTTARITRPNFAAGSGTVPVGSKCTSSTGFEYITYTSASFGATDLESTCLVRAVQAGKSTQIGKGALVRFSNPGTLFDPTLVVTNDQAAAGGEDAEDDETYRNRVRLFWRAARRGILGAIELGALTVEGVVSAQAIEALTPGGEPARVVMLYIADSSGVASDALATLVRTALDDYRAGGIQVLTSTSLPLIVGMQLRLAFRANVDTTTLTDDVKGAVVAFVNSLPVNGTLYLSDLYSVLKRYAEDGLIVGDGTIVAPTGDLVPGTGQTLRTTLEDLVVLP